MTVYQVSVLHNFLIPKSVQWAQADLPGSYTLIPDNKHPILSLRHDLEDFDVLRKELWTWQAILLGF